MTTRTPRRGNAIVRRRGMSRNERLMVIALVFLLVACIGCIGFSMR